MDASKPRIYPYRSRFFGDVVFKISGIKFYEAYCFYSIPQAMRFIKQLSAHA